MTLCFLGLFVSLSVTWLAGWLVVCFSVCLSVHLFVLSLRRFLSLFVCLWLVSEPSFRDLVYRSRRVVPTGWEGVNVVNWSSHRHVSTLTTTTTSASTLMPTKSPSALDLRRDLFLQAEKAQCHQVFSSFFSSFVRESQIS